MAADPTRDRVVVKEALIHKIGTPFRSIDLDTGKIEVLNLHGADLSFDSAGNMYVLDGYNTDSMSRYDPKGKPLPFEGSGSHKIENIDYLCYGPDRGSRGHCVAPDGNIYLLRALAKSLGSAVEVYGPDGKYKKTLVPGLGGGDAGIGVDAAGNVYVGSNLKKASAPLPAGLKDRVPADNWLWWKGARGNRQPPPWGYTYCNPYLVYIGSVFKFGPEGGAVYGYQSLNRAQKKKYVLNKECRNAADAPPGADAYKSSYLDVDVKVAGAKWSYLGVGAVPNSLDGPAGDPGCVCSPGHLDVDLWGRVYAPDISRFSVVMLDSAGNMISRIGGYGNADSAGPLRPRASGTSEASAKEVGPGSSVPEPEIAFVAPQGCAYARDRLSVADHVNRRLTVIRFDWSAEETCKLP